MELLRAMILQLLFVSIFSFANTPELRDVAGYVSIDDGYYYLVESSSQRRIRLAPLTATVKTALSKLKTHDYISGSVELVGQSYILHSVDSVGLRRILGIWQADKTFVEFQSFHLLKFFNQEATQFTYTLTPDVGSTWKVFLTNEDSVTLGTLRLNSTTNPSEMTFELFDSTSGTTIKKVNLKKVKK